MSATEKNRQINMIKEKLSHPENLGTPCMVMSRVTGYYRNVNAWNAGKQEEFQDRKSFLV